MTCDKEFLDMIPKVHSKKEIMINQSSTKYKILFFKNCGENKKINFRIRENIANCISNNGLISRLFKEFSKCNYKIRNNPI